MAVTPSIEGVAALATETVSSTDGASMTGLSPLDRLSPGTNEGSTSVIPVASPTYGHTRIYSLPWGAYAQYIEEYYYRAVPDNRVLIHSCFAEQQNP